MASQLQASGDYRVVVGLGATGLSCARYLHARDLPFSVVDTRLQPPGLAQLQQEMPGVCVYTDDYPEELIAGASELVVSPGLAMDSAIVTKARAAGVEVVGDIDLFVREAVAPVVGITGSNAKSTVTELLGQMARDARKVVGVGGNLGTPALELLSPECELYVLELSSFQLERAGVLNLSVATILNISADHLDRHGDMSHYQQAKHRIFLGCDTAVVNRDDPVTMPLLTPDTAVMSWGMGEPEQSESFGLREHAGEMYLVRGADMLLAVSELQLVGRHNVANTLAALALGSACGFSIEDMLATVRSFKGLAHRCELVAEVGGVRYVNDSKGTNIGATEAALKGLGGTRDVVLIAGGQGKGADFTLLQSAVEQHCKLLVLLGEDAALLQQALSTSAPVVLVSSMAEAVQAAAAVVASGDCVLLSPACASFDMYSGYVQRGEDFRTVVVQLVGAAQ